MDHGAEVLLQFTYVGGVEGVGPVVSELLRREDRARQDRRLDGCSHVGVAIVADIRGQDVELVLVSSHRILGHARGAGIRPDAVRALITMERTERDEGLHPRQPQTVQDGGEERVLDRWDVVPLLVEEVDHVRVAVTGEAHEERLLVIARHVRHERAPAAIGGVVEVDDEPAVHVRAEDRVLVVVADTHHLDPVGELLPDPVTHDVRVVSLVLQFRQDPTAVMIREQDLLAFEQLERGQAQMIRMPMRQPDVAASEDGLALLLGDRVRQSPAAEVSAPLDPWVRGEKGLTIVEDQGRVARGVKSDFHDDSIGALGSAIHRPLPDATHATSRRCARSPTMASCRTE